MPNPYDPPPTPRAPPTPRTPPGQSDGGDSSQTETSGSKWGALALLAGLIFLVGAAYFVYLAMALRADYRDLHDPTPGVDGYWPAIVHDLYLLLAGILGFAASGSLILGSMLQRKWRSRHRAKPRSIAAETESGRDN